MCYFRLFLPCVTNCLCSKKIDDFIKAPLNGSSGVLGDVECLLYDGSMASKINNILHSMLTPLSTSKKANSEKKAGNTLGNGKASIEKAGGGEKYIFHHMPASDIRRDWIQYVQDVFNSATASAVSIGVSKAEASTLHDRSVNMVAYEIHRGLFFEKTYLMYDHPVSGKRQSIRLPTISG